MKRTLLASAAVGTLLLIGAGAANADSVRFDVHIGAPLYGMRHLPPPPPRVFVMPRRVRYWVPMHPRHYRHHNRRHHWHGDWGAHGHHYRW
jgi:hypothetical protein